VKEDFEKGVCVWWHKGNHHIQSNAGCVCDTDLLMKFVLNLVQFLRSEFFCCNFRKEKASVSCFNKWRTSTLKSLNQTWSQCLLAPGTWVTTIWYSAIEYIWMNWWYKNRFSNPQEMLVLRKTLTPGFSVRSKAWHKKTRQITSHMSFMWFGVKKSFGWEGVGWDHERCPEEHHKH